MLRALSTKPISLAQIALMKTKQGLRGASQPAIQSVSHPPPPLQTHMYCPIKVFYSSLCAQADCHRLPSSKQSGQGKLISLSGPDRPRRVMLPALTLHHLWVGTGAWAQGYKRPGEVQTTLPPPTNLYVWTNCQSGISARISFECPEAGLRDFTLASRSRVVLQHTVDFCQPS